MKILEGLFLIASVLPAQFRGPFHNVASQAGLRVELTSGSPAKAYILESMTGGVGLIDYDDDGWLDIYLVNGSTIEAARQGGNTAHDLLYRNNRDGTFSDVSARAGLGDRAWGMGVAVADVDNNGLDDLYVTNYGPNRLYFNLGNGKFREDAARSGVAGAEWSSSAAFADYDQDGDLDLYVANYLEFRLDDLPEYTQLCRYRGIRVQCGPRGLPAAADRFYENLGKGRFRDRTEHSGLGAAPPSYGLGVIWADYDNDGDLDAYVANDSLPNFLFQNNGGKTFTETALLSGAALSDDGKEQAGMGVDFGDYDNDGDLDLLVTNFSDDYNTLYRNEGGGQFRDVSYAAGLSEATWTLLSWGAAWADFDNDGDLDVAIANGHVYPEVDSRELGVRYRQPNSLFLNDGQGHFSDPGGALGPAFEEAASSRGLAAGDFNNDGWMDLLVANLDEPPSLLMNPGGEGRWIMIDPRGTASNRSGVGTRVTVQTGGETWIREARGGGSYQSHHDRRLHFGLAAADAVERVTIRWPGGRLQYLENVEINQILKVEEPEDQ